MRHAGIGVEPDRGLKTVARSLVGLDHGGKSKLRLIDEHPAKSRCRGRKTRVEVERLLEMVGRRFEALPVVAICSMQSAQVKVVCLRIPRSVVRLKGVSADGDVQRSSHARRKLAL